MMESLQEVLKPWKSHLEYVFLSCRDQDNSLGFEPVVVPGRQLAI